MTPYVTANVTLNAAVQKVTDAASDPLFPDSSLPDCPWLRGPPTATGQDRLPAPPAKLPRHVVAQGDFLPPAHPPHASPVSSPMAASRPQPPPSPHLALTTVLGSGSLTLLSQLVTPPPPGRAQGASADLSLYQASSEPHARPPPARPPIPCGPRCPLQAHTALDHPCSLHTPSRGLCPPVSWRDRSQELSRLAMHPLSPQSLSLEFEQCWLRRARSHPHPETRN